MAVDPQTGVIASKSLVKNLSGDEFLQWCARDKAGAIIIEMFGPMTSHKSLWWIKYRENKAEETTEMLSELVG